ncbi:MAG: hypothetical protein AB7P61_14420, partial [Gemmatimonadales bacterium]
GCRTLIGSLPAMQHDKRGTGDAAEGGPDHAPDGLRYLLMGRPPLTEVPLEELPLQSDQQRVGMKVRQRMARALAAHNRDDADLGPEDVHPLIEILEGGVSSTAELFDT